MKDLFGSPVSIVIPAHAEFVQVVRSVVAGVAARLDYSFEEIDDLRIAVDEACGLFLRALPNTEALSARLVPSEDGLELTVRAEEQEGVGWPPPGVQESLTWRVLAALVDDTSFGQQEEPPTIRMFKRIGWSNGEPG